MQAELGNKQGERITVCDNSTFDRYITDGWSVLSIFTEERQESEQFTSSKIDANSTNNGGCNVGPAIFAKRTGGKTSTDKKRPNKTGKKGWR